MEQSSEDPGANGQAAATPDVDDDYLKWQEEIRLAEEEAQALKAGKTHRYHKDFRKQVEFSQSDSPAVVEDSAEPEPEASAPAEAETEFTDDDGTVYKWDPYRNAWIPQANPKPFVIAFLLIFYLLFLLTGILLCESVVRELHTCFDTLSMGAILLRSVRGKL